MNSQFWWYVSRSSGLVTWALVSATIVWGVLLSTRVMSPTYRPAWLLDLHKWLAALSVAGVTLHLVGLVADTYVDFGWQDLSIPMVSQWKPGPVAWGIVATYMLVAVQATSLAMKHLSRRFWHAIHLTSYAMFVLTTVHAFTSGTDARNYLFQIFGATLIFSVVTATGIRLMRSARATSSPVGARANTPTVRSRA